MSDRTSMTLTADRRALEDRARGLLDHGVVPDSQWRTTLYDLALKNLIDTIRNHENFEGDPELAKQFNTRVVRSHYDIEVETRRP